MSANEHLNNYVNLLISIFYKVRQQQLLQRLQDYFLELTEKHAKEMVEMLFMTILMSIRK